MQHWMKSSNKIVPLPWRSNFLINVSIRLSDNLYPNDTSAVFSSFLSILPELSLSKDLKQFCQSVTYFHNAPKSSKLTWPLFWRSNIPRKHKIGINRRINTMSALEIITSSLNQPSQTKVNLYTLYTITAL